MMSFIVSILNSKKIAFPLMALGLIFTTACSVPAYKNEFVTTHERFPEIRGYFYDNFNQGHQGIRSESSEMKFIVGTGSATCEGVPYEITFRVKAESMTRRVKMTYSDVLKPNGNHAGSWYQPYIDQCFNDLSFSLSSYLNFETVDQTYGTIVPRKHVENSEFSSEVSDHELRTPVETTLPE